MVEVIDSNRIPMQIAVPSDNHPLATILNRYVLFKLPENISQAPLEYALKQFKDLSLKKTTGANLWTLPGNITNLQCIISYSDGGFGKFEKYPFRLHTQSTSTPSQTQERIDKLHFGICDILAQNFSLQEYLCK